MTHAADELALEELEQQQIDSWAHDGAAFAATFTDDADLIDVMGGHFHGRAAITETMQEGFATFMAGTRMSPPTTRIVDFLTPAMAVVITSGNCIIRPGEQECRPEDLSIQTKVAVKQDGQWLFRTFQNTRINAKP
ncbi:SgcJ/EcaC family oxidoreductase [Spongiactinospora rosea]|uniref:SgcJ/EcaC family oxidoreductase n=1 Tax=Spongiactinospora rosea TaxID=2248750 RepID=UPI0018F59F8F|nr:SgcJ/EcaC family oxidoreductase [Spongiactinospora rosea]